MNLVDLVKSKVKDSSGKLTDPDDYLSAVTEALNRYSKARPFETVADIPGDGGHDYDLPSDWLDGFSTIPALEYPVDQVPEQIIDRRDWKIYSTPAGKKLRLLTVTPAADETLRITYTVYHTEDSVPAVDLEAVANLAASVCCIMLAAAFGQSSDSIIQADSVNYGSKADSFRRLAGSLEGRYKEHLGIKDSDTVTAAMATAAPPDSTRIRLTHGRK